MSVSAPTADFQTTTLNGAITAIASSMTIGVGLNIPATNGVLQIDYDSTLALGAASGPETIFYTSYTSGTGAISGMTRGVAGTTGVTHANGCNVQYGHSAYWYGNNIIQNTDLATNAITLGYAQITSTFTTTSTSLVDVTGVTTTVTVPSGGRRLKVTVYGMGIGSSAGGASIINAVILEDGVQISQMQVVQPAANSGMPLTLMASKVASAGSHTYKLQACDTAAGTTTIGASATQPCFILVELI